ncbi:hypothetical protein B484DRAFT_467783 [Ochromonadaceae sp. CCMP2298]|nr:hypothetical protein B484DRAFT_467783 [Ochromonadaceae sp. CCMP2298]
MPHPPHGKQRDPVKGRVSTTGKPLRGAAQNDKRNGQRREKRLRAKVAVLKAHVVEHIEAGIEKARGLKRKHTDPGSESSKEQWAILQAKQAIYKLDFIVLELIRRKENLRRGERGAMPSRASIQLAAHQLALATKGLLRPEIDTIKMVMPMRPLMEEMLRLSGWTQEHGVAPGPAGEFIMFGARTFRLCVTCDSAQLTKGNKGFIILCYKPLEPEVALESKRVGQCGEELEGAEEVILLIAVQQARHIEVRLGLGEELGAPGAHGEGGGGDEGGHAIWLPSHTDEGVRDPKDPLHALSEDGVVRSEPHLVQHQDRNADRARAQVQQQQRQCARVQHQQGDDPHVRVYPRRLGIIWMHREESRVDILSAEQGMAGPGPLAVPPRDLRVLQLGCARRFAN